MSSSSSSPFLGAVVSGASFLTLTGLVYRFLQPPIHSPAFLHINKHTNNEKQNNDAETANAVAPATPDRASSVSPVTPVAVRSPSPSPSPAPVQPSTPSHSTVSDSFASSATLPTPPIRSGLSKTSLYIAAGRSIESSKPQSARLFFDPFAAAFAGSYGRAMLRAMATEMRSPERVLADYVAVRTKFLDSQLLNALVGGIDQLVLLSVGCDARSLRLEIPQGVTVYEVDSEETLRYRSDVIDRVRRDAENADSLPQPKCRIVPVPADIRFPSWVSALENAGFNRQKRSFFLVEGLLMYLTNAEVDVLLHQLASLTVSHSRMAGDMLNAQYFLHEVVAPILNVWERWSSRPVSGSDLPEAQFASAGWAVTVKQFGQDPDTDFGRIPQVAKDYYLKEKMRGEAKDIPRNWLFIAERS